MLVEKISWQDIGFSQLVIDYISKDNLKNFYTFYPSISELEKAIGARQYNEELRHVLVEVLQEQYQESHLAPPDSLRLLARQNARTVTTGHQLCLMTGPLYTIYKILTTLNLAELLSQKNPSYCVVPIFWLASEDHDFAEVNHFHWFGKRYEFFSSEIKGAIGRCSTSSLANWLESISQLPEAWKSAYTSSRTWSEATRKLLHHLFGKYGLVILDADDRRLKRYFVSIAAHDLFDHIPYKEVQCATEELEKLGYKIQMHPRTINLFYIKEGLRERIEKVENQYHVLHTEIFFSNEQIRKELENYPERFSPNVVLRPLYQETILPNVAYVGGPSEIAYWLQLKKMFSYFNIPMPALVPRQSVTILTPNQTNKLRKLEVSIRDLFLEEISLKKKYTFQHSQIPLVFPAQKEKVTQLFAEIESVVRKIDASLVGLVQAEQHKALKSIEHIEKKLEKAAEQKQEVQLKQLLHLREKVLPNNIFQERYDNILSFYLNYPAILETLKEICQPFVWEMIVLHLEN
ncbi:MAG: bacillithiol biosynthesis cysteine-adding enzyme BshC [Cytophagales bacterium]|nr:bacillithiol biosynthesis cysteine-adding enzyme BshC [Cytophagales bacterium]MDW8384756.1 bacillithiol biosynthesis cysteine-adding enzyme BshC [Flammeovirgaceae bacterium]